jgi:hypothetical protein
VIISTLSVGRNQMSIYKSLSACKADFKPIKKESENPYFKSKYADLETIKSSVDSALLKHGLVIVSRIADGNLHTSLVHIESGDAIDSVFPLTPGLDAQKRGSEITYGRRYSIQCLLDLVAEDDDGNQAVSKPEQPKRFDPFEVYRKALAWLETVKDSTKLAEGWMSFQTHADNFKSAKKEDLYNQVADAFRKKELELKNEAF